jgi:hypothetical protein
MEKPLIVPPKGMCTTAQCQRGACSCFDGHCMVTMFDGTTKYVKDIRMDDVLFGGFRVMCVVQYNTTHGTFDMVKMGSLCITPWHPLMIDGVWQYPKGFAYTSSEPVYNLVLDCGHTVDIGGITCCTLAHKFTGPVIEHPYWGTNKVTNDLMQCPGWTEGFVSRLNQRFSRDVHGMVDGMMF